MLVRLSVASQADQALVLKLELERVISSIATGGFGLNVIRHNVIETTRHYKGFIVWAPSIVHGCLFQSLIWYWEHGVKHELKVNVSVPNSWVVTGEEW